jgi:hypothetical protein
MVLRGTYVLASIVPLPTYHPLLCWAGAAVETLSWGQPTNSGPGFGPCANGAA